ncbi:unnamed protein product, partial [marine sediment metagenome]
MGGFIELVFTSVTKPDTIILLLQRSVPGQCSAAGKPPGQMRELKPDWKGHTLEA